MVASTRDGSRSIDHRTSRTNQVPHCCRDGTRAALPGLDRELFLDVRDPDAEEAPQLVGRTPRVSGLLRSLLSELVLGPARHCA